MLCRGGALWPLVSKCPLIVCRIALTLCVRIGVMCVGVYNVRDVCTQLCDGPCSVERRRMRWRDIRIPCLHSLSGFLPVHGNDLRWCGQVEYPAALLHYLW